MSRWWVGVGPRPLCVTTQWGIKAVLDPLITRCWRINDRSMRYNRLKSDLFTDYMFANRSSTRGNNGGQVAVLHQQLNELNKDLSNIIKRWLPRDIRFCLRTAKESQIPSYLIKPKKKRWDRCERRFVRPVSTKKSVNHTAQFQTVLKQGSENS